MIDQQIVDHIIKHQDEIVVKSFYEFEFRGADITVAIPRVIIDGATITLKNNELIDTLTKIRNNYYRESNSVLNKVWEKIK